MLPLNVTLSHYKRRDIQEEIIRAAENKEIAVRYNDTFGSRPDVLNNPNDILELAKQGATSFHCSEELWSNPLQLNQNMKKHEIDELRIGWDLVLDIDCPHWEFAKITTHLMIKSLRYHGIESISCKFSGNKGFHIGVPFESFKDKKANELFPEGVRDAASYLLYFISKEYIDVKGNDTIIFDNKFKYNIQDLKKITGKSLDGLTYWYCNSCKKKLGKEEYQEETIANSYDVDFIYEKSYKSNIKKISSKKKLCGCQKPEYVRLFDPLSIVNVDTILISSRHLFRMPYSLHEKSGLVSLPINPENVLEFEKEFAKPTVEISRFMFLDRSNVKGGEGKRLLSLALDFAKKEEGMKINTKKDFEILEDAVPEELFPPCIKLGLAGLKDGRKRFVFSLINFLVSAGWGYDSIEKKLKDWNKKNQEPLREVNLLGQLRYHKQQKKKILPPNCNNAAYYLDIGICKPDNLCNKIKNPVSYAIRKTNNLGMFVKVEDKLEKRSAVNKKEIPSKD